MEAGREYDLVRCFPVGPGTVSDDRGDSPKHVLSVKHLRTNFQKAKVEDGLREEAVGASVKLLRDCPEFVLEASTVRIKGGENLQGWVMLLEAANDFNTRVGIGSFAEIMRWIALNDEHLGQPSFQDRARDRNVVSWRNVHGANMRDRSWHERAGD